MRRDSCMDCVLCIPGSAGSGTNETTWNFFFFWLSTERAIRNCLAFRTLSPGFLEVVLALLFYSAGEDLRTSCPVACFKEIHRILTHSEFCKFLCGYDFCVKGEGRALLESSRKQTWLSVNKKCKFCSSCVTVCEVLGNSVFVITEN